MGTGNVSGLARGPVAPGRRAPGSPRGPATTVAGGRCRGGAAAAAASAASSLQGRLLSLVTVTDRRVTRSLGLPTRAWLPKATRADSDAVNDSDDH